MTAKGTLAFAKVMAHCGGSPSAALSHIVREIAADPRDPGPYAALDELRQELPAEVAAALAAADTIGPVVAGAYFAYADGDMDEAVKWLGPACGYSPEVPWARAPWFGDPRFLATVTPVALAEATMRISDPGRDLTTVLAVECLEPWFAAIETVCDRDPIPDQMARMAILLRACGRTTESFALCDRADAVRPVMLTEVVRAGTWRALGNRAEASAAFHRALALEPGNWSLYLDLADLAAEQGEFAEAAALATRGEDLEPHDVTMAAAAAAYRARATGAPTDRQRFAELASQVPEPYRGTLAGYASAS
ncbi:tetratricopeptide repeat protein [Paractinoplanes atraurantiacus]|uniref:Tetratricopeptide repeat-containing protein n=1 Tax=Paractinoplanes atraurantiacus TaxID=1036182 RepID=A0A285JXL9_9ACTN|nr:tetratricopeptide repeat protein [Actinoplanes atraurantiacus]SNY65079.1 Tetratricopeptide repeat-containing protein [Actinoplanes atraurantiacus]